MRHLARSNESAQRLTGGDIEMGKTGKGAAGAKPDKPQEANKPSSSWGTIKKVIPYLWPVGEFWLRVRVVISLGLMVASKFVNLAIPLVYKNAVDDLASGSSVPLRWILYYGALKLLAKSLNDLRSLVFFTVSQNAMRTISLETFDHLHGLSLEYHLTRNTGSMLRSIDRGTKSVTSLLSLLVFNIVPTIIEIVMVTAVLLVAYEAWFGIITFVTISAYIAITISITEWRRKFRKDLNEKDGEANDKAVDALLNYETVKMFAAEEHERSRFDRSLRGYVSAGIKSQASLGLLNSAQNAIIAIGLTIAMGLMAKSIVDGDRTVGDFVLINVYIIQLYTPLNWLGTAYRVIIQGIIDMEKLFELLAIPPKVVDVADAPPLRVPDGRVEFREVVFSYNDDAGPVLKGISFTVPPGKMTALVGHSGAGKSTIGRLLFRFYDVDSGDILIDGQSIRAVRQTSVRRNIGVVPQDTVLFNDSLKYNLRYGRPEASDEDLERAVEAAQLDGMIARMPSGFDTKVGERGLRLSGGEKQRVAIARTILKNSKILLLDEATSALDSATEQEIQSALAELSVHHTTLVIAHRLSTIINADEILVLDNGNIAERGTHRELLALEDGIYREMWQKQLDSQEADA